MSDLREKISALLNDWGNELVYTDDEREPATADDITDRILALLPKVKPSCDASDAVASAVQSWEAQKRAASGREAATWPHICEQSRQVYLFEADKIIDSLAVAGYRITKTGDEPSLPKVPELRWDGTKLRSGEVCLGKVVYSQYVSEWGLYDMMGLSLGWRATEPEARAAVEAAVRKALGWEA